MDESVSISSDDPALSDDDGPVGLGVKWQQPSTRTARSQTTKAKKERLGDVLAKYPLEPFTNWALTATDRYYVEAPLDKLGEAAFHTRSHITALILAGNPAIEFLQRFESPRQLLVARIFAHLGQEEFYFLLIASMIWCFDARLGRLLAALLAASFAVAGFLKNLLCLPRPPAPPARRLAEEDKDWAWPSNHALVGTAFPWFVWIYVNGTHEPSVLHSLVLLALILFWNVGIIWSRVFLAVHSPCDVLAGWTIGVLVLFVFEGFAARLHSFHAAATPLEHLYLVLAAVILCAIQPRVWPETQSYGEVVAVSFGALAGVWATRGLQVGGQTSPVISLIEQEPEAATWRFVARILAGCILAAVVRIVVKQIALALVRLTSTLLSLEVYSYSQMNRMLGAALLPTKRYTTRMRFRPIAGQKVVTPSEQPYDMDIAVKAITYTFVGFCVGEGAPAMFKLIGI